MRRLLLLLAYNLRYLLPVLRALCCIKAHRHRRYKLLQLLYLLIHGAVLGDVLPHLLNAVKRHHIQRSEGLVRKVRAEESHAVQLLGAFVLRYR